MPSARLSFFSWASISDDVATSSCAGVDAGESRRDPYGRYRTATDRTVCFFPLAQVERESSLKAVVVALFW